MVDILTESQDEPRLQLVKLHARVALSRSCSEKTLRRPWSPVQQLHRWRQKDSSSPNPQTTSKSVSHTSARRGNTYFTDEPNELLLSCVSLIERPIVLPSPSDEQRRHLSPLFAYNSSRSTQSIISIFVPPLAIQTGNVKRDWLVMSDSSGGRWGLECERDREARPKLRGIEAL